MVIAHHVVFACYGFWLPNEERGSWSTEVWAENLRPFGEATKTDATYSLARRTYDREKRRAAREALKYPPVRLDAQQRLAVAVGFGEIIQRLRIRCFACAVMPDHSHLVLGAHRYHAEEMIGHLKRAASRQLTALGCHPLEAFRNGDGSVSTPWVEGGWKRYLNTPIEAVGAIDYVDENPEKLGLPPQPWSFVIPFPFLRAPAPRGRGG
jgi:hypothetical protein